MAVPRNPFRPRPPLLSSRPVYAAEVPEEEALIYNAFGRYPHITPARARDVLGLAPSRAMLDACRRWLGQEGLYQLPTLELVETLREECGDRTILEICAGHGWLGEALGARSVDNRVAEKSSKMALTRAFSSAFKQPLVAEPLPRVEHLDAVTAVRRYQPQAVVGAYVTVAEGPWSLIGVHDPAVLSVRSVEVYALTGSLGSHGHRPLLARPHRAISAPWLVSRGDEARLWIWARNASGRWDVLA